MIIHKSYLVGKENKSSTFFINNSGLSENEKATALFFSSNSFTAYVYCKDADQRNVTGRNIVPVHYTRKPSPSFRKKKSLNRSAQSPINKPWGLYRVMSDHHVTL